MTIAIASHLSDTDLEAEVKRLVGCEREITANLIAHLAEFDARRLYLGAGFSSLFTYCCGALGLSEHETYNRIEVARAARRFPRILGLLCEGSLNLTTVRLVSPHLTDDNQDELLAAACGKSKRAVEELVARRFPQPDAPASVRKLPAVKPGRTVVTLVVTAPPGLPARAVGWETAGSLEDAPLETAPPPPMAEPLPAPTHRPVVAPLAPDRYQIRFTASTDTCEKLRLAQDLLRHVIPTGDMAQIIDRALTVLLEDLARKKFAATGRPRASRDTADRTRHVPAAVKRAVWLRDGGRCVFSGKTGRRCNERGFLEFHHVQPYAVGGEATVGNIELRCRGHNAYEAHLFYGCNGARQGRGTRSRASWVAPPKPASHPPPG